MTLQLYHAGKLMVRAADKKEGTLERKASFVAATEIGVESWFGREWLRMSGVKLERFRKNPVLLDTHNRYVASSIVGRVTDVRIEGRQLIADVEFADTPRALEVWSLVDGGFLRAVSVGFQVQKWKELEAGQFDGEGEARVEGPGVVIEEWELVELSVCPVPADQDALIRRSLPAPFGKGAPVGASVYAKARTAASLAPEVGTSRSGTGLVATLLPPAAEPSPTPAPTTAPAPAAENRSAPAAPAPVSVPTPASQPAPPAPPVAPELAAAERVALEVKARRIQVQAIAPESLKSYAEELVTRGLDVEACRAELLVEWKRRSAPVGMPDPPAPPKPKQKDGPKPVRSADLSDDAFAGAFKGSG